MESNNPILNSLNFVNTDNVLRYTWFSSVIGFVLLFTFILHRFKNINPNLRYTITITSLVLFMIASFTTLTLFRGTSIQAERDFNPTQLSIVQSGPAEVTIQWNTNKEVIAYIKYKTATSTENSIIELPNSEGKINPGRLHTVKISNLEKNTRYSFVILQNGKEFKFYRGEKLEFTIQ